MNKKKTSSEEWQGGCPFCNQGKDCFIYNVERDFYYCRKCNVSGTMSWLQHEKGDGKYERMIYTPKPLTAPELVNQIDFDLVPRCFDKRDAKTIPYYNSYGIEIDVLDKYEIGWYDNGPLSGYFIPQFVDVGGFYYALMGAEVRIANPPSDEFRFYSIEGSKRGGFHQSSLVNLPGYRAGPTLPYLFIVEAVKDAMVLEQCGFYATAYKQQAYWNSIMQDQLVNVACPIIIQDNDWKFDEKLGKDISRGKEIADKVAGYMRRSSVRMTTPNYKQPSDMALALGITAVKDWILEEKPWIKDYM